MLKNLKNKDKKQTKEKVTEKKQPKAQTKKQPKEDEDLEVNDELVDINYQRKQTTTAKPNKKAQTASKLEEKIIDTSTIVIEKKEEKKAVTSWVVNETQVKKLLQKKDFNMQDHDTDFVSLTDSNINKELEQKAKREQVENKPKIKQEGGLKFAPLQPAANQPKANKDQELVLNKKVQANFVSSNIPIKDIIFTNSNTADIKFKPLQKTPQQLKQEELEAKRKKQPELVLKRQGSWLGGAKKKEEIKPVEFKVSAWAAKANQVEVVGGTKFAPLQKSAQQQKTQKVYKRQEQQFVFVNKKEAEERRKARQENQKKKTEAPVQK